MLNRIICIGLLCLQNGSVCMATDTGTLAGMPTGAMAGTRRTADDTVYATPQQRIDIGGRSLNLVCIGHGSPTVVFDSGMGDWSVSWALVQPRIGKRTRACGYDRAGLGFSDPSPRPSNSANMVDDLHRLLRAGGIAPPYLLVGHSLGGLNLQLFADRHLPEVAGMVLVDASHPQTIARVDAATNGAQTRHWKAQVRHAADCVRWPTVGMQSTQFRAACIEPDDPRLTAAQNATRVAIARTRSYQQAQLSEASNYLNGSSFAQAQAARRSYNALPLIVLTSGKTIIDAGPEWLHLQQDLAKLSQLGQQRTVPGAGHDIQRDAPDAVAEAIETLLDALPNQ